MFSRTSCRISWIILLNLVLCISGCSKEVTGTQSGSLTVTILDGNSAPISGALVIIGADIVYIWPPSPPDIPQHGRTNQNGIIGFPDVITGEHLVAVQAEGFKQYDVFLRIIADRTTNHFAILSADSTSSVN